MATGMALWPGLLFLAHNILPVEFSSVQLGLVRFAGSICDMT